MMNGGFRVRSIWHRTSGLRAHRRRAGLSDPNGRFQQKPTLVSTALNVLSWSRVAAL